MLGFFFLILFYFILFYVYYFFLCVFRVSFVRRFKVGIIVIPYYILHFDLLAQLTRADGEASFLTFVRWLFI